MMDYAESVFAASLSGSTTSRLQQRRKSSEAELCPLNLLLQEVDSMNS